MVRLSALGNGRLYSTGDIVGTHLCLRLNRPQDHNAAGEVTSMKNSSDHNENRSRDLRACKDVPQLCAVAHKDRLAVQ